MAMPFATGAHVPAERLENFKDAFMAMNSNPEFQEESDGFGLERSPIDRECASGPARTRFLNPAIGGAARDRGLPD